MCGCEHHHDFAAPCTCECPEHAAARHLAAARATTTAREFRPGDVALIHVGINTHVGLRDSGGAWLIGDSNAWRILRDDAQLPPEVRVARPLVVIDPEDTEQVERLWRIWTTVAPDHRLAQDCMQAALREFADPKPRCVAHGEAACPECSRIRTVDFSGGECLHCSAYGTDGMHWDTCPGRIRGPVFASRDEAMEARP